MLLHNIILHPWISALVSCKCKKCNVIAKQAEKVERKQPGDSIKQLSSL